ncbi:MAG: flavodoxin-dependent (E)-4-hydroxy-3-methylbut-2-enyl-diphosphate synthase [Elusimicrobiota bacterium]|nr:flavodoxin-dependent (E)-4-hydroxy-3-methylbut-2-enyl-diphosphate synthase [Endomicrobiia bacterium]MDW8165233.1 flavodoxin-dependent (E)-4-hydroxy-3-methylbut-2-enyl-diphosphate synthase [Elusimicrobiota bacterium]
MIRRKETLPVKVGSLIIGGKQPIVVQTMTKTDTKDIKSTIAQIKQIESYNCKLIRLAVPDMEAAEAFKKIKESVSAALVADIHFDYKIAIECIKNKADKIRINPANIKDKSKIAEIIKVAKEYNTPIRVGFNAGSYKVAIKDPKEKLLHQIEDYINLFEKHNFKSIVISAKTSDVISTVEIYQILSQKYNYPLHIGITEAGPTFDGIIKSTLGIGILLWHGIGDTIRVSLTSSPIDEVKVGYYILQYLNLLNYGIEIISCPTCGRCKVDLINIVAKFEKILEKKNLRYKNLKVAIMGCEVNGPGEASSADIGIAMGKNFGVLFLKGKIVKKISYKDCIEELIHQIEKI